MATDSTETLRRLVKTLRRQCDEKEQRIKTLFLQVQRLEAPESGVATTLDASRSVANELLLDNSSRCLEDASFRAALVTKDREIDQQQEWLRQSRTQVVNLQHQLSLAESAICRLQETMHLRERGAASDVAKQLEADSAQEMEDVLRRQGVSLMGYAGRHIEQKNQEVKQLQFEVKKKDRIIASLKDRLQQVENREQELESQLNEIQAVNASMQDQLVAFREHDDAHVNATVALNSAHIEALRQKSEGLERRFNETEELLGQKDHEIQSLQTQLGERDSVIWNLSKKLQGAEFDLSIKKMNLLELEKDRSNNEEFLLSQLESLEENREIQLRRAADHLEAQVSQLSRANSEKDRKISALQRKVDLLPQQIQHFQEALQQSEEDKNTLKQQLIELEVSLVTSDKTSTLEAGKQRELEYQKKLRAITAKCQVLQHDSVLLQKCRSENAALQKRTMELKSLLETLGTSFTDSPAKADPGPVLQSDTASSLRPSPLLS